MTIILNADSQASHLRFPIKPLAIAMAALVLSSCAVLESGNSDNSAPVANNATTQSNSRNSGNAAAPIPVAAANDNQASEQQSIIDEINRAGAIPNFNGYRETEPSTEGIEGEDVVELNYEQADLRLVLEELADALGITIIIDPAIDDKISIRTSTSNPLQKADIWPLIRLLVRDAGVVLEQEGGIYTTRKIPGSLPIEITTPDGVGNGTAASIMQITPITYVSTETAMDVISPMLDGEGEVSTLANSNILAITTSEAKLYRINQLLTLIDSDPFRNQGIHVYQLSNGNATEVADELKAILEMIEGPNPAYQVRGIERINAVLVTSPASRGFDDISSWVAILDADSQEQVEQLFHYKVKNLNAVDLANTLSNVFEEPSEEEPETDNAELEDLGTGLNTTVVDNSDGGASDLVAVDAPDTAPTGGNGVVSADLSVKIVADEGTNSLLIRSTARDYRQLLTTISQLDAVPLQVMVTAVIAQITLTDETRFGVDWSRIANDSTADPISTTTTTNYSAIAGGLLFTKSFLDGAARVEATLDAIATNNDVRLLSRPSLTVINNQEGEIQIGAEVPVQQGETVGGNGISTTNIQYRPTGIELYITPQINDDNIVNLTIKQVLSSVDNSGTGVGNNPVFNNQEISTTVVVRDGENIVLGGLIQSDNELLNTGVPILNEIPVLGKLFSFQQDSVERRELFIVLRPEIVDLNEASGIQYEAILERFTLASEVFESAGI